MPLSPVEAHGFWFSNFHDGYPPSSLLVVWGDLAVIGRVTPQNVIECAGTQSCRAFISRISSTVITNGVETKLARPRLAVSLQRVCSNLCELLRIARESRPVSDPMTHAQNI